MFGATETGQKVCAHIHGALPYLFIGYEGSLEKPDLDAYIRQIRVSIDHALAVSYRRNIYDVRARFVGHITLVKGVPFFGYHVGYRYFLKIYMLNPLNMTRFADLLYQGAIMKKVFQPFEAHLQYLLQWMCDFNLYGCAYIDCDGYMFRETIPSASNLNQGHKWHDQSIRPEWVSPAEDYPRQSHCSLELDVRVQDIANRAEVQLRDLHADFGEHFQPGNPEEKLVRSLAGLWMEESKRRKRRMGLKDNSSSAFPPEVLVSMSADSRNTKKGGWVHEDDYRAKVRDLVGDETTMPGQNQPSFKDFVQQQSGEDHVQSVLESVEDLFSDKLKLMSYQLDDRGASPSAGAFPHAQAIVDEASISYLGNEDLPFEPDNSDFEPIDERTAQDDHNGDIKANGVDNERCERTSIELGEELVDGGQRPSEDHVAPEELPSTTGRMHRKELRDDLQNANSEFENEMGRRSKRRRLDDQSSESVPLPVIPEASDKRTTYAQASQAGTPVSSQQLSQSRIKSDGDDKLHRQGFKVTKPNPMPSSQKQSSEPVTPARNAKSLDACDGRTTSKPSTRGSIHRNLYTMPKSNKFRRASPAVYQRSLLHSAKTRASAAIFEFAPPTCKSVTEGLNNPGLPTVLYQDAYYSDEQDVPESTRDYAGREFKLIGSTVPYLPPFDPSGLCAAAQEDDLTFMLDAASNDSAFHRSRLRCRLQNWEWKAEPPSWTDVQKWLNTRRQIGVGKGHTDQLRKKSSGRARKMKRSQIDGPTQKHPQGFKFSQKRKSTSVKHETQYMSTMSLEVHVNTRHTFVPNPEEDEVACIFWCIKGDDELTHDSKEEFISGILVLADSKEATNQASQEAGLGVEWWLNELDLMNRIVDIVREFDPDILTGYEVHNGSWGYLIERARIKYEFDLCDEFSRMLSQSHGRFGKEADRWGFNTTSTIRVTGRHMINIWRAMRSELNLLQYTMENVVFHLLHKRIPHYTFSDLTAYYTSSKARQKARCLQYFLNRTRLNLEILEANELVPRTSEQARLIGVDFFSVFSRGSQFKVESFMFRIAKPENFLLASPSRKQVGQQNALECLPLVMEPLSAFYTSPLLVLDFQSLYPSIMIAYNYCYSTCLGRVVNWRGRNKMGFADFQRQPGLLQLVKDSINIAPNGMMFVKPDMRRSLLAKMLGEILETRLMVKSGMKADRDDKTLQQLLNNRQLALKLLANVTYGYTSASFSGRMPCSEIADSIVQTGRETLEKAIALIHSVERWGAEVVYGDTDSLFVYLKGRTRNQAFNIGNEIAATVTKMNPRPVKLKFEKVYHPCVLLAKKRYVGFKYESKDQVEPDFDAKGIETIRRDGTPAEQKIEEKALKILFQTSDLSQVKSYFLRQCVKIMTGNVSIQDFCFAREVKLGTYADKRPPPPGALISTKKMLEDARTEPQYGERIPYVVTTGAPSARLIDRCVAPESLLEDETAELDAEYYINKNLIPPLERIFNLVGANVRHWYDDMPKVLRARDTRQQNQPQYAPDGALMQNGKTLEGYLHASHCLVCRSKLPQTLPESEDISLPVCEDCLDEPTTSLYTMQMRLRGVQKAQEAVHDVCRGCSGLVWVDQVRCDSKDCPVFYTRVRADKKRAKCETIVDTAMDTLRVAVEPQDDLGLEW